MQASPAGRGGLKTLDLRRPVGGYAGISGEGVGGQVAPRGTVTHDEAGCAGNRGDTEAGGDIEDLNCGTPASWLLRDRVWSGGDDDGPAREGGSASVASVDY